MRYELPNEAMFRNLAHALVVSATWATYDNTERPLSALNYPPLADYARSLTTAIVIWRKHQPDSGRSWIRVQWQAFLNGEPPCLIEFDVF